MSKESCSVKVHHRGFAFDFWKLVCQPVVQSRARIPWELQGTLTFPWLPRGGGNGASVGEAQGSLHSLGYQSMIYQPFPFPGVQS